MAREIKFRAWDKITDPARMKTWEQLCAQYQLTLVFTSGNDAFQLMQYTGLKDKNGKEIYEGDIIEIVNNLNEVTKKTNTHNAVVKYKEGSLVATWQDEFVGETFNYFNSYNTPIVTFEIIGNIYENPGLLKEGE